MIVNYFGDRCFRLQSGDFSLLVDPNNNRLKADVVLKTLSGTAAPDAAPHEIVFPGEYEIKGLEVQGWPVAGESTEKFLKSVFMVRWEDINFLFLGHLSKLPDPELMEKIAGVDVMFFPLDGDHFLSNDAAAKLVKQLEPHLAIPSFSKSPSEILKIFGQKGDAQEKLVFKKKDILAEQDKIVVLKTS